MSPNPCGWPTNTHTQRFAAPCTHDVQFRVSSQMVRHFNYVHFQTYKLCTTHTERPVGLVLSCGAVAAGAPTAAVCVCMCSFYGVAIDSHLYLENCVYMACQSPTAYGWHSKQSVDSVNIVSYDIVHIAYFSFVPPFRSLSATYVGLASVSYMMCAFL